MRGAPEELSGWRLSILRTLRDDAGEEQAPAPEDHGGGRRMEVLAFGVGSETFGIDIAEVAEILLPRPVTVLPRSPSFIAGVVSLRGTVLPVIDLALRLGLPPAAETGRSARILVVRDADERIGFRVDHVSGVVRFAAGELEATDFASAVDPKFLRGIGYDRKGNLIAVLRGEKLCAFTLTEGN